MEVHPPHAPLHTWKDFWIHLGTITIGLLIAISLEQSVEALHRVHERHQLEQDLHSEAIRNAAILDRNLRLLAIKRADMLALRHNVDALRRDPHARLATLAPANNEDMSLPTQGAWTSARDSAQLALLPRDLTDMYEDLYAQRDFILSAVHDFFGALTNIANFTGQFSDAPLTLVLDPAKLTPAQLDIYSGLITRLITQEDNLTAYHQFYQVENQIVLDGASSEQELKDRLSAKLSSH